MTGRGLRERVGPVLPGSLVALLIAVAAQFLSEHYGAPAMLMALLLGIAFHFLAEEGRCVEGVSFVARAILRVGVALLGVRISVDLLIELGAAVIALVVLAIAGTILIALLAGRLLGRDWRLALLTGGSVAICGASAAMAISAVLPKSENSERNLIFTVLGVTVLSTVAMIAYPIVVGLFALDDRAAGVFLGGTIHDVAQVVGAGFSVSETTGETATLVKLIRVTMLAPVVLVFALVIRRIDAGEPDRGERPPLVPGFVLVFLALATLNSLHLIPAEVAAALAELARWALLVAIAAVGMKTSLKRMADVGATAIILMVVETAFIAGFVLAGIKLISGW